MEKLLAPVLNNKPIKYESIEQKVKRFKEYFSLSHGKGKKKKNRRDK